jgi:predicted RNase H-like HicB family nuclease
MYDLKEAAGLLGLSPRQVRRRVDEARPLIAPYLRRGNKNKILLTSSAIQILRALEDCRKQGKTIEEALREVSQGIRENAIGDLREDRPSAPPGNAANEVLIKELRDRITFLEAEVARLWALVGDLKNTLALPAPAPRRPWWRFWGK